MVDHVPFQLGRQFSGVYLSRFQLNRTRTEEAAGTKQLCLRTPETFREYELFSTFILLFEVSSRSLNTASKEATASQKRKVIFKLPFLEAFTPLEKQLPWCFSNIIKQSNSWVI